MRYINSLLLTYFYFTYLLLTYLFTEQMFVTRTRNDQRFGSVHCNSRLPNMGTHIGSVKYIMKTAET